VVSLVFCEEELSENGSFLSRLFFPIFPHRLCRYYLSLAFLISYSSYIIPFPLSPSTFPSFSCPYPLVPAAKRLHKIQLQLFRERCKYFQWDHAVQQSHCHILSLRHVLVVFCRLTQLRIAIVMRFS